MQADERKKRGEEGDRSVTFDRTSDSEVRLTARARSASAALVDGRSHDGIHSCFGVE